MSEYKNWKVIGQMRPDIEKQNLSKAIDLCGVRMTDNLYYLFHA